VTVGGGLPLLARLGFGRNDGAVSSPLGALIHAEQPSLRCGERSDWQARVSSDGTGAASAAEVPPRQTRFGGGAGRCTRHTARFLPGVLRRARDGQGRWRVFRKCPVVSFRRGGGVAPSTHWNHHSKQRALCLTEFGDALSGVSRSDVCAGGYPLSGREVSIASILNASAFGSGEE